MGKILYFEQAFGWPENGISVRKSDRFHEKDRYPAKNMSNSGNFFRTLQNRFENHPQLDIFSPESGFSQDSGRNSDVFHEKRPRSGNKKGPTFGNFSERWKSIWNFFQNLTFFFSKTRSFS